MELRLRLPLVKDSNRIRDASLPRLGGLRSLDREHVPSFLAVGQPLEDSLCTGISPECGREVGRHGYLARFRVEFNLDIHLVATGDACVYPGFRTHPDHELPAHGGDAAPVRVVVDCHADLRALAGTKAFHDVRGYLDARGCLAG